MFTSITLRYIGEKLSIDSISTSLGVLPTASGSSGDSVKSTSGKERVLKAGFWEWSIKAESDQINQINDQIESFGSVFNKVLDKLGSQLGCSHSWIDIHIIEDAENFPVSLPINSKSMSILSKAGLLIDLTISN